MFVHASAIIRAEAKNTYLGYLWWLLDPLMFIAVYYVVFGIVLKSKTDNYIVFLLIGILTFQWYQSSINQAASSVFNAGGLIKRLRLPKSIFVFSKVIHAFWQFIFVMVIYTLLMTLFFGLNFSHHYLALPIIIFVQLLVILGVCMPLASIYPFFPDIKHIIQPVLRAMLFLSGVFFSSEIVPENLRFWFFLNPMANLIESYRMVLIDNHWPDWSALLKVSCFGIVTAVWGIWILKKRDSDYAKVIP